MNLKRLDVQINLDLGDFNDVDDFMSAVLSMDRTVKVMGQNLSVIGLNDNETGICYALSFKRFSDDFFDILIQIFRNRGSVRFSYVKALNLLGEFASIQDSILNARGTLVVKRISDLPF